MSKNNQSRLGHSGSLPMVTPNKIRMVVDVGFWIGIVLLLIWVTGFVGQFYLRNLFNLYTWLAVISPVLKIYTICVFFLMSVMTYLKFKSLYSIWTLATFIFSTFSFNFISKTTGFGGLFWFFYILPIHLFLLLPWWYMTISHLTNKYLIFSKNFFSDTIKIILILILTITMTLASLLGIGLLMEYYF